MTILTIISVKKIRCNTFGKGKTEHTGRMWETAPCLFCCDQYASFEWGGIFKEERKFEDHIQAGGQDEEEADI